MKNITVVGAGTMGNGIAHVCAQHGFKVILVDLQESMLDGKPYSNTSMVLTLPQPKPRGKARSQGGGEHA